MNVSRGEFEGIISRLMEEPVLAIDTETGGLRPYHGDRLFSIAIASFSEEFYFNWQVASDIPAEFVLTPAQLSRMQELFGDTDRTWAGHNLKFDLHMLAQEGLFPYGVLHCTKINARIEYNDHMGYALSDCLGRIGQRKDDAPLTWVLENKAWDWVDVPGKSARKKNLHYDRVPFELISPYAQQDARGAFQLYEHQTKSIEAQSKDFPANTLTPLNVMHAERRLTRTVWNMEHTGVRVDRRYCERALEYETEMARRAAKEFKSLTGKEYSASPLLFKEIFASETDKWSYTEKGNPSFDSDAIAKFESPAAKEVVKLRDAKSKQDFYNGFLYHIDRHDILRGHFHQDGTTTGRFSSSDPNLQNLSGEDATQCRACKSSHEEYVDKCLDCGSTDVTHPEFMVRKAFIPRPGNVLVMIDFKQQEYRLFLDYAKTMQIGNFLSRKVQWSEDFFKVANDVRDGVDVHEATAKLMGVKRKQAKTLGFMLLYAGGVGKLATALGTSLDEATRLRSEYFKALPYVSFMINQVQATVKSRGWVRTWSGRKLHIPNAEDAYRAPNALIQGGCADITKRAMVGIEAVLQGTGASLVLSIHDEVAICTPTHLKNEVAEKCANVMRSVYPYWHIPMDVDIQWSDKSLAEKAHLA